MSINPAYGSGFMGHYGYGPAQGSRGDTTSEKVSRWAEGWFDPNNPPVHDCSKLGCVGESGGSSGINGKPHDCSGGGAGIGTGRRRGPKKS